MKRPIFTALLLAAFGVAGAAPAHADGKMVDLLRPYAGKPISVIEGHGQIDATLERVGDDYFCATVKMTDTGRESSRCYAAAAIRWIANDPQHFVVGIAST